MAFAQLTYRESLRDIEACLGAMRGKLYHMGFRGRIARSTLADADDRHDWRIYADFAQVGAEETKMNTEFNEGHGKVESKERFPLSHPPGYCDEMNQKLVALH